ncbi:MAG: hypothetical protein NTX32_05535 [Candidatus Firestonebacteria bacterium]|nr:hypothetical protein [Candidatus Firestonebacteria bacterium]
MEKRAKSKLIKLFILTGVIPALLLTVYFSFLAPKRDFTAEPNTPNVLQSEKNNAVSLTARNSWYLTMLLRKVEMAGRLAHEVITGVYKRQNVFITQDDYKKIKTDSSGKFLWNPEKEAGVLFVCGGYKAVSKDGIVPVIGSYLDNTLSLVEKSGAAIESVYIMTESALRKYPWVKADDLVKTGLFKAGNYKIKPDTLFSKEENSPYRLAGPDRNKNRLEIWTEAYWSQEYKGWMISYFMPIYENGVYKGVLGADISLQKLLEKLIGKDQEKKFSYADTFPVVITKSGVLVASSFYGYEMLQLDGYGALQSDLKSIGNDNFKASLAQVLNPGYWYSTTNDEDLGGIENVTVNKKEFYLAHFPMRTGGLTLALFIPAANLEKSAVVSVTTAKPKAGTVNLPALIAGLAGILLSIALMLILIKYVLKKTELSKEEGAVSVGTKTPAETLISEEKKIFEEKLWELNEKNAELVRELENTKDNLERSLSEKKVDYKNFVVQQPGPQNAEPDPSKYVKTEYYHAKLEEERMSGLSKINEFRSVQEEFEARLRKAQEERAQLEEKLAELEKNSSFIGGNDRELAQRLNEMQQANNGVKDNFEKLKKENEELIKKVKSLEGEGRNLAQMMISKMEQEKKNYEKKIEELNKQVNLGASRVFELENKIKTDSVKLAQMDPSKFIPLMEVNTRIEADRKNFILKIQELESRLKEALEKTNSAFALAKEAGQKKTAPPGGADLSQEEVRAQTEAKIRELEAAKLDLAQKNMLLLSENIKMMEALRAAEKRKKETDKQAQSLILKVGEDHKELKGQIKELGEKNVKLMAERDASKKHYETMNNELKKEQAKGPSNSFIKDKAQRVSIPYGAPAGKKNDSFPPFSPDASPVKVEENNLLLVDDRGEIIKYFGDILYNMGYSVYIARNAEQAKQKLATGKYRNMLLSANLSEGDYKELFEAVKKEDAVFAERIVFYNNDDSKDKIFLAGRKIIKHGSNETEIKNLMA